MEKSMAKYSIRYQLLSSFLIAGLVILLPACRNTEKNVDLASSEEAENSSVSYDIRQYRDRLADDRVNISEYEKVYSAEMDTVRVSDYDNIHFESCEFKAYPEAEQVGVLTEAAHGISTQEAWDTIETWLERIGKLDEVEMEKEVGTIYIDISEGEEGLDLGEGFSCPLLYNHMDLETGVGAYLRRKDCSILFNGNGIVAMSDGKMSGYLNSLGMEATVGDDAYGSNSADVVKEGTLSEIGEESWQLIDGELSVNDGAELVREHIMEGKPYPCTDGVTIDIPDVRVFRLGNVYGYDYTVRHRYKGVPFAYMIQGSYNYSDDYYTVSDMENEYVADSTGVTAFYGNVESSKVEELLIETKIIGMERAVGSLSEKLAPHLNVMVDSVEMVYFPLVYGNNDEEIVFPCWEFRGVNTVKGEKIWIYLDMLTGDIYYYTANNGES